MPDDPIIYSDDPNAPPPVTPQSEAYAQASQSDIFGNNSPAGQGTPETPDQSGQDVYIPPDAGPTLDNPQVGYDQSIPNPGINLGGTEMNPIGAGSMADGVVTALQAGYSWDNIAQYVAAAQPLNGGPDQLISGSMGGQFMGFKKPSLQRLMDPSPITAQDLQGNGF